MSSFSGKEVETDKTKAEKEYKKYIESRKRDQRSCITRSCFSIFIAVCMLTDVWKMLHGLFPQTIPSYEKSFSNTVKSLSSVTVEPYKAIKHHSVEDFVDVINKEAFEYLVNAYSNDRIPNITKFEEILDIDFKSAAAEVKEAINHSWQGYKKGGWGYDSVRPVTGEGVNDFSGLCMTMLDSIDSLYLAGLHDEIEEIKVWLAENFRIEEQQNVNIFEMNIRVLGGLLSAYHLTNETDFLLFSEYVASKVVNAFVEPSGIPYGLASFGEKTTLFNNKWTKGCSSIAEIGTLSLELEYTSRLTGKQVYRDPLLPLTKKLHKLVFTNMDRNFEEDGFADMLRDGLFPAYIEPISASFSPCTYHQKYSLGGSIDSVYEYFLKLYIMTGKNQKKLKELYLTGIDGAMKHLLRVTRGPEKFVYLGERIITKDGGHFLKNMDHLACYVPGMLALGVYHNITTPEESHIHMDLAKHLMRTCYMGYKLTETGLGPEGFAFSRKEKGIDIELMPKADAKHSFNRPETIESLHLMLQVTGDPIYKLWALEIFKSIQKHTRTEFGYSGVFNVNKQGGLNNKMESFFISETLKYLLLIFSEEDVFPIDKYVFNTEAHPFPIHS